MMMAYTLPNIVHQTHVSKQYSKDRDHQQLIPLLLPKKPFSSAALSSPPPPILTPAAATATDHRDDFFVNVGLAVRTLRHDLPLLFSHDLDYHIYRDDIVFVDPLNTFCGMEQYKLIFWALRFHGRMLFKDVAVEILGVCQPSQNLILIRWNLRGAPRVPWEASGQFQATSRYKLDRKGKIYEHKVDNLAFNSFKPPAASNSYFLLPTPTWFYDPQAPSIPQQCLATCS